MPETATQTGVRELTFGEAIREALAEEMRRDSRVCIIGEDVAEAGTPFKVLSGLVEEFGKDRVIDTPISEPGFTGIGVGAAMTGLRPVVDIMFGDFLTLIMDQIVNQAAKIHYMSGGTWKVPMVLRTTLGATRRSAAQHSQSLHAWLCHVPGLKVVLPSTPYDAKGLLKTAIRDENPVVFFEDKMMYRLKGPVPSEEYTIPLGVADIKRSGTDITLVATSSMVQVALGAAKMLEHVKAKVYVNKHEADGVKQVAGLSDSDMVKVDAGDTVKLGDVEIKFLHTPGHTPGSQCFLVEGNLVSGDTLFVNSCGRVDLPGSDPEAMYYSLNRTLRSLPDTTVVYPGHAYSPESSTTIGAQKRTNMYMRFPSLEDFLDAMGYARR